MSALSALQISLFDPEGLTRKSIDVRSPTQTLPDVFPTFEAKKLASAKPATVQKYCDSLAHWKAAVGSPGVDEIRDATVLAYYRHLLRVPGRHGAERLADHSIHYHLSRVRAMLRFAHDRKLLAELPDFPEHPIDHEGRLRKYWVSREEIELVLPFCDRKRQPRVWKTDPGDWWRACVYVTWWCANRISETLALTQAHLDGDVLTIPKFKRAKRERVVVLDERCLELLGKLRHGEQRIFHGLSPNANLARHFQRLFGWAGIQMPPGNAWHSLRRGRCESEFLAGGKAYAQARLGHRDLATTEASYLREQIERAASIEQQRALMSGTATTS